MLLWSGLHNPNSLTVFERRQGWPEFPDPRYALSRHEDCMHEQQAHPR